MKKEPKKPRSANREPASDKWGPQKAKERLEAVFEQMPVGMFIIEAPSGRISYANPAGARIFGTGFQEKTESYKDYPKWMGHDLEGKKLKPEDYPGAKSLLHAQTVSNQLIKFLREDGTWIWVRTSSAPLRDNEGKIIAAVVMTIDVSDEIEMQLRIEDERTRLRVVLESLPVGVGITDENGKVLQLNEMVHSIWGGIAPKPEKIEQYNLYRAFKPDTGEEISPDEWGAAKALKTGESTVREVLDIMRFDGSKGTILHSSVPIKDSSGKTIGAVGVVDDITEIKKLQEELRQTKSKLEAITQQMPVAVRVVDRDGKWIYANEEAATLFHAPTGNWPDGLGINWKFLYTDGNPYAPSDHPSMRSIRYGEIVRSEEMILMRGDGSKVSISTNSAPIRDSDGNITAAVVTHFDITKRVRAERDVARLLGELQKHSIELERARKSLETTIDKMPIGVAIAESPSGRIVIGNAALEGIFRRSSLPSGVLDDYQAWEAYQPDGMPLEYRQFPLARALIFGEEVKGEEIHIIRGDGTRGIVLASAAPVRNPQGNIDVAVMIMVDVTEQKEMEKVHGEQSEELARSNAELQQFAYIASHDLQEPLRMITGFLQLLEKRHKGELSPEAQEYIDYSVKGAKRMQELINDLLFYTRVGRQQGRMKPTDMNSALVRALENLSQTIKETNATITSHHLPTVLAERTQMMQVFQNLIGNALKFRGEEPPIINIDAERVGTEWVFSIEDNGIGIDPQYHLKIFQIFQRLHSQEDYPGTGMGLPITKRIVERHNGRLWVESELGKGCKFLFALPAMD
jgi:PAS domain S-box-containing protein